MPPTDLHRRLFRAFHTDAHVIALLDEREWLSMRDEDGRALDGIRGRVGAEGLTSDGLAMGVDLIEMSPGSEFPLHVHPGDHVLVGHGGAGMVHVDGVDYPVWPGVSVFVAADQPHGVRTFRDLPDLNRRAAAEWDRWRGDDSYRRLDFDSCRGPYRREAGMFRLYAVGVPHEHVESTSRMHMVDAEEEAVYRRRLEG